MIRSFSGIAQPGGPLPKIGAPGTDGFLQDQPMFCFGAAAALGGAPLEGLDDVARNISNQQLGHFHVRFRRLIATRQRARQAAHPPA